MNNFRQLFFPFLVSAFAVPACAGGSRTLIVRSEPADADVCIKGKSNSEYFSNQKSCVGTTPFEADKVEVMDPNGAEKHTVHFKDLDKSRESFYVVVSRQGYASQALEVPGWDHMVVLKPEGAAAVAVTPPVVSTVPTERGSVHITSEPLGALVYIDGQLKGNTPFTHEGPAGVVRMKLELEGYAVLEKAVTVEPRGNLSLNFKMIAPGKSGEGAATPTSAADSVPAATPSPASALAPSSVSAAGSASASPVLSAAPLAAPPPPAPLQAQPMAAPPPIESASPGQAVPAAADGVKN